MTLAELPQVQTLSITEKLALVDEIWLSVASSMDSLEVSQEHKDLLDYRWDKFLKNPSSALTVDAFKEQVKKYGYGSFSSLGDTTIPSVNTSAGVITTWSSLVIPEVISSCSPKSCPNCTFRYRY